VLREEICHQPEDASRAHGALRLLGQSTEAAAVVRHHSIIILRTAVHETQQ
jgi:hypothetical protein